MVDKRDVLIKAAEDVSQGMWCKGSYFTAKDGGGMGIHPIDFLDPIDKLAGAAALANAERKERCALGSLALATQLLGGTYEDWNEVALAVNFELERQGIHLTIAEYNDERLPDDPFEAGQQLAELFRQTADSL